MLSRYSGCASEMKRCWCFGDWDVARALPLGKRLWVLKRGSSGVCGLWPAAEPSQNKRRNAKEQKTGGENSM